MKDLLTRTASLASPVIWFLSHMIQVASTGLTCVWHSNAVLWLTTAIALLLDFGSGWVAWTVWQNQPARGMESPSPMPRWLALSGIALSGSFFLVITAQAIPGLLLTGCE